MERVKIPNPGNKLIQVHAISLFLSHTHTQSNNQREKETGSFENTLDKEQTMIREKKGKNRGILSKREKEQKVKRINDDRFEIRYNSNSNQEIKRRSSEFQKQQKTKN